MGNLILFINAFLSYFILFILIVALVFAAIVLGIRFRKAKDAKLSLTQTDE